MRTIWRWILRLLGWAAMALVGYWICIFAPVIALFVGGGMIFPGLLMVVVEAIRERSIKALALNLLVVYVYLPLMLGAILAPLLAVALAIETYVPGKADLFTSHWDWDSGFTLPWIDLTGWVLAALGLLGLATVLTREGLWLVRQRRQIQNLATSRIGSAALGLVEMAGVVRALPSTDGQPPAPIGLGPWDGALNQSFYLEDETGRVRVDPRSPVTTHSLLTRLFKLELCETDIRRSALRDGDPLYIIGTLERDAEAAGRTGTEALVLRRRSRPKNAFLDRVTDLRTAFLGGGEKARGERDIFFISDTDEHAAAGRVRAMQHNLALRGVVLVSLCLWLLLSRLDRLYPPDLTVRNPAYHAVNLDPYTRLMIRYCYHDVPGYRVFGWKELAANPPPRPVALILYFDLIRSPEAAAREAALKYLDSGLTETEGAYAAQLARLSAAADPQVRRFALLGLGQVRAPRELAVPVLIAGLDDPEVTVRVSAMQALGQYAPESTAAVAPLIRRLPQEDYYTKPRVRETLLRFGAAARDELETAFASTDAELQCEVTWVLARLEPPEAQRAFLQRAIGHADGTVRTQALWAVREKSAADRLLLLPFLRSALIHADPATRNSALITMNGLQVADWNGVEREVLLASLRSVEYSVRQVAWRLCVADAGLREPLHAQLLECLAAADDGVAIDAMDAMGSLPELKPAGAAAMPLLITALENKNRRGTAAKALAVLGPAAAAAAPALWKAAVGDDWHWAEFVKALVAIQSEEYVRRCLQQTGLGYSSTALQALSQQGPQAVWAVPLLLKILQAPPDPGMVETTVETLGRIGVGARAAVPALEKLLADDPEGQGPILEIIRTLRLISAQAYPADWPQRSIADPILHWRFDETLEESTGKLPPAAGTARLVPVPGDLHRTAAEFTGAEFLEYPLPVAVAFSGGYTVELVTQLSTKPFSWNQTCLDCDLFTFQQWPGVTQLKEKRTNGFDSLRNWREPPPGAWAHSAVVLDPYTLQRLVYINGREVMCTETFLVGYDVVDGRCVPLESELVTRLTRLKVGNLEGVQQNGWIGLVADIRVYDYPRSAEQIAAAARAAGVTAVAP